MNYLRGAVSAISAPYQYYKDINPSTLTGAIDVIVVRRHSDEGEVTLACSPFHVRFGKLQVLRPAEKKVTVSVNGSPIPFNMKIGDAGEAFFVFETDEDIPEELVTSPILSATETPSQDEIPAVTLGKSPQVLPATPKIPEPEFLDLNATPQPPLSTLRQRGQSFSIPPTPPLEVDFPHAPAPSYADERIPFPPLMPSTPSHLQTSFPARRVVSESPHDIISTQDDFILKRSRSVPPELEGSPHTIRSPLPHADDHDDELPLQPPIHPELGEYKREDPLRSSGQITARHDDRTKFQVFLDGNVIDFELSLVASRDVFHHGTEVESACTFDQGIINYEQFVADENLVHDERLVIRWSGSQYITRGERSPLMDSLQYWASVARVDRFAALPSPPLSPRRHPSLTEQEIISSSVGLKRAESEPPEMPMRKSTSSSWVRWWSRSRDIPLSERPILQDSVIAPPNQKVRVPSHLPPPSASAPATTPVAAQSPMIHPVSGAATVKKERRFAKSLRLSSDQLKSLNLKPGANTISFSLSTTGTPGCAARIFLWESTNLVVISDIDGTITKSDGLGHIYTMIGRDWTHLGVAKLYTDITRNGYKIMYLTSRAIGQADSTRDYLRGVKQNDYQLPEGPVIMSPDRLMTSLHREVIMRKPEVFKMACLRDIQRLFGDGSRTPFYAGFGNRITDALSYRSVNVPSARIFTIDPSSEVKMELLELAGYKSSYIHMTDLVDQMFPPINQKWTPDYTDFNYWRPPVQEFPLPDLAPPSPALSARSDTSSQSALARLRNFSLVGSRQPVSPKAADVVHGGTDGGVYRSSHLRQMSSLERLSSRLVALAQSSSYTAEDERVGSLASRSSASVSSTCLDSEDEGDIGEDGELRKERRPRSTSMSSMPGSLDDMRFELDGYEEEGEEGGEEGEEMYEGENEEEAAEEAFDEDFLATGEMQNVPFL